MYGLPRTSIASERSECNSDSLCNLCKIDYTSSIDAKLNNAVSPSPSQTPTLCQRNRVRSAQALHVDRPLPAPSDRIRQFSTFVQSDRQRQPQSIGNIQPPRRTATNDNQTRGAKQRADESMREIASARINRVIKLMLPPTADVTVDLQFDEMISRHSAPVHHRQSCAFASSHSPECARLAIALAGARPGPACCAAVK